MRFILDESLGFIVHRTDQRMKNNLLRNFKSYGVTPEQWGILNQLCEQDGITQKELSERTFKDQPTVTRILDKLEKKGIITRQPSPDDRRAFLVFLTDKGRNLRDELEPIAIKTLEKALNGFTEEEIKQLKALLNRVFNNLD